MAPCWRRQSASDYTFTAPETLSSGLTTIRLTNHGTEPHHGQLLRLNDGVTFDQFTAALQEDGEAALRLVSGEGGPGTYRVVNDGPQMHELNVLKMAPGKTAEDVLAWETTPAGPPPFEAVGGMNAFSADGSG